MHPNQITDSKTRLAEGAPAVFGENKAEEQAKVDITRMQAKIGESRFPPFPQTLKIDEADFHISTATTTTDLNNPCN